MSVSLGADVEVIIGEGDTPKSIVGIIGGSKHNPLPVRFGNLQEDNVMAEFAIDPVFTLEDWIHSLNHVYHALLERINPHNPLPIPSCNFPDSELQTPQAQEFGCDPDLDVYTLDVVQMSPDQFQNLRTCGGHVHVGGISDIGNDNTVKLIRLLDIYLGVPSVLLDKDNNRRRFYGQAGRFRVKPYGIEYRTLSNFWIQNDVLKEWVYNNTMKAVHEIDNHSLDDLEKTDVRHIIHDSNIIEAQKIVQRYGVSMP